MGNRGVWRPLTDPRNVTGDPVIVKQLGLGQSALLRPSERFSGHLLRSHEIEVLTPCVQDFAVSGLSGCRLDKGEEVPLQGYVA